MIIMVCPYCKKEKTLERQGSDPTLFGCVNCHSVYSETFLLGYMHGWVDRGVADKAGKGKKTTSPGHGKGLLALFLPHAFGSGGRV